MKWTCNNLNWSPSSFFKMELPTPQHHSSNPYCNEQEFNFDIFIHTGNSNIASTAISSPSNSMSSNSNYYNKTPNHSLSSGHSNYVSQVQSSTHQSRRPNRNSTTHNTTASARSTPNLPTSTPVHQNYQSPSFSHATPNHQHQAYQVKHLDASSTEQQTNPKRYYHSRTSNTPTSYTTSASPSPPSHQQQQNNGHAYFSTSTVSSLSAASVAAGRDQFTGVGTHRQQLLSSPPASTSYTNSQSSTSHLARVEERVSGRGITRSSASYGIQQLLQDQVNIAFIIMFHSIIVS